MATSKKKGKDNILEKVKKVQEQVSKKVLLRDASTGKFFKGVKPCVTCSPSGNYGGEPFWEV